jgi:hypothetical protein
MTNPHFIPQSGRKERIEKKTMLINHTAIISISYATHKQNMVLMKTLVFGKCRISVRSRIIQYGIKFYASICGCDRRKSKRITKQMEVCYYFIFIMSDLLSIFCI